MANRGNDLLGELIQKEGDKYSDLIIKCHDHSYHVHRNVICVQSNFLAATVDEVWKEGSVCEIFLGCDEADIDVVQRLIEFLYCRSLDDEDDVIALTKLYIMGDKWHIPFLKTSAASRLYFILSISQRSRISTTNESIEILRLAYEHLLQPDKDLKRIILKHILNHDVLKNLMRRVDFLAFVTGNRNIVMDLLDAQLWIPNTTNV